VARPTVAAKVRAATRRRRERAPCSAWACCRVGGAEGGSQWSSPSRLFWIRESRGKTFFATPRLTTTKVAIKGVREKSVRSVVVGGLATQRSSPHSRPEPVEGSIGAASGRESEETVVIGCCPRLEGRIVGASYAARWAIREGPSSLCAVPFFLFFFCACTSVSACVLGVM
jgi:hypothetical protein